MSNDENETKPTDDQAIRETPEASPSSAPAADARTVDAPADEIAAVPDARGEDESATGWARHVPLLLAIATPLLFFFILPPLYKSGLWDPYELNVADLARRLALNVYDAKELWLSGADNSMPHLNDLGRPELPFDSIGLGFKVFGLHEWAGRAPLAVWGTAGALATYAFVARLVDKRAGLYAAVALCSMPLFFVGARTMLGDVVTMSAIAMSFGGFTVAVFDRDKDGPTSAMKRLPWIVLGVVGLVAGFESRGGIIGLAVPLTAVGLAWGVSWAAGDRRVDVIGDIVGAVLLVAGVRAMIQGYGAIEAAKPGTLNMWVGAMIKPPAKYPTFDYFVGHIGPALAPWSAFAPFALGRLFLTPPHRVGNLFQRESFVRMALVCGTAVAFAAHGWLAAKTELVAFSAPALLAAASGIAIRDYERGAHPSIAVGVGTGVFLGVFHHDFHEIPDKAYQAFAVVGAPFPESFKTQALLLWTVALVGFAGVAFLTWVERESGRKPFDPAGYLKVLNALREAWDGLLALAYFAMVAGASLAGLTIWVGVKTHAKWLPSLSLQIRDGVLNAWWVTAFVPLGIILGIYFACDVWLWAFGRAEPLSWGSLTRGFEPFENLWERLRKPDGKQERLVAFFVLVPLMVLALPGGVIGYLWSHGTRPIIAAALGVPAGVAAFLLMGFIGDLLRGSRAAFFPLFAAVMGLVLCFSYYPALANQLSPKEVFESYQRIHKDGEPLALFGVGGRTSAYYAGGEPKTFNDANSAFAWLTGDTGTSRRFLVMKTDELAKLNSMYREKSQPRENLPVLDGRSSQIVLVASRLAGGEKNQNPLSKVLLQAPPKVQHRLDVEMEEKLLVIGYDLTDQTGRLVESVAPGRKYHFKTYYKVLSSVTTEWEAFIHIDGFHRRHNGDHKPMDGKYPFHLWLKDDLLVDDHEFNLEPNFTPGAYTVYFGLFVGDTRLKVTKGPSDGDNRINGGPLNVQ
jgi:Dolichyl-phosphate-mannose-protein mannosyltransferase